MESGEAGSGPRLYLRETQGTSRCDCIYLKPTKFVLLNRKGAGVRVTLSHGEIKKLYFGNTVVSVWGCFWASKLGPSSTFHLLSSLVLGWPRGSYFYF